MKEVILAPLKKEFWGETWNVFLGVLTPTGKKVPIWLKGSMIAILLLNYLLAVYIGPIWASAAVAVEFIIILTLSSYVFPLLTGGLLFMQILFLGLLPSELYFAEVVHNDKLTYLLIFVVTGVDFLENLLKTIFSQIILGIKNIVKLSIVFMVAAAVLSANMDALTVTAVMIKIMSAMLIALATIEGLAAAKVITEKDRKDFHDFLYGLMMSGLIGTMLGGVMTLIGEPQNYDIGNRNGWGMEEFFMRMLPVSLPVFWTGLISLAYVVKNKKFGYGVEMPSGIRLSLIEHFDAEKRRRTMKEIQPIFIQMIVAFFFVYQLFNHKYELAVVGLFLIILVSAFTGINSEETIGKKFKEAMGFVSILLVFYSIVALINHQKLFNPVIEWVMDMDSVRIKAVSIAIASGVKSIFSDNVLVELVWMTELDSLLRSGSITAWEHDYYSVALNAGTNVPSILTPNGSAPFLFFFLSSLAVKKLNVRYFRMVRSAFPIFVPTTIVMVICVYFYPELFNLIKDFVPESTAIIQSIGH